MAGRAGGKKETEPLFDNLSDRLSDVFGGLRRRGALTEQDVSVAMREVRVALLEADVALPVVKSFTRAVGRKATGQAVMRSIAPGDLVIKIVHDELIKLLHGNDGAPEELRIDNPPAPILMVGLQGSGKTTSSAKIARWLTMRAGKSVIMASLDTRRPAAMEQLRTLGEQAEITTLPIVKGQSAPEIAARAMRRAEIGGFDVVILDTAGRLHIDQELMREVVAIRDIADPRETLLVLDGLTGQDAVVTASEFDRQIGVSGVVLTRMESDGRGGAALSMRSVTGKPIRFVGTGEKLENIERFDAERIAGRILGMGDIVALVEKAAETLQSEATQRAMRRMQKGRFNFNDMRYQLESVLKMGGVEAMLSNIPGMKDMAAKVGSAGMDDRLIARQVALINSMTRAERANPSILQASRRRRIAAGAGLQVSDLNQLVKLHNQMARISKSMSKRKLGSALGSVFGMPGQQGSLPSALRGAGFPGGLPGGQPDGSLMSQLQSLMPPKGGK